MVVLATRLKVPSIALLLVVGIAVGPEGAGILNPDALGRGLDLVVGMAVAIILFEGGLTLDLQGARRSPVVIRRMLTVGVLITWLGTALALWWLLDLSPSIALLCGSLVIVTGPTVISPLLRRINVRERLKHILYWEAVLVDAIGVFIAVLCFEWLNPGEVYTTWSPVVRFAARVALGAGVGLAIGALVAVILRRHLVSDEQANIFVLAMALLAYAVCEAVLHESGILAVIVAGLIVGLTKPKHLAQLKRFKLELTELGIGMLFILLAAKLDLDPFLDHGWRLVGAVAVLLLVLRPLMVLIATWGRGFSLQEKLFLSWIAPRGIVAAFMASLFALALDKNDSAAAATFVQTFTFAVIATTVILQGLSAPFLARLLGLEPDRRRTWLIVGDDTVATDIAGALRQTGVPAMALAPPDQAEPQTRSESYLMRANPLDQALLDDPRFGDVGFVLTLSPNPYFNQLVCERWAELVGSASCFRASDPSIDGHLGFAGTPVWSHVAGPGELEQGIEGGTLAIDPVDMVTPADTKRFGKHLMPLFLVSKGADASIWSEDGEQAVSAGDKVVTVRRRIPGLAELIADAIVVDHARPDLALVLRRLLGQAARQHPGLPIAELEQSILERERSMPTAMGSGIAIPHAYYTNGERSECYVANVRGGLDSATPDGEPIRLVFLVLSPVGRADAHLRSLASIAQLARDRDYSKFLERQESSKRLLRLILERA